MQKVCVGVGASRFSDPVQVGPCVELPMDDVVRPTIRICVLLWRLVLRVFAWSFPRQVFDVMRKFVAAAEKQDATDEQASTDRKT